MSTSLPEPGSPADLDEKKAEADLRAQEAAREAEYRKNRRERQKEEYAPLLLAVIASGHVANNPSEKATVIVRKAREVLDAIFENVRQFDGG